MKIVVIGGTGLIGSKVVAKLRAKGHEVIAGSPQTGINTLTGEGLDEAFKKTQVVIDLANSPSFEDKEALDFFTTAGNNIFAAEALAKVKHHIALSIVGTERLANIGYFRAKLAQEKLIKESGMPYSIIHSTQFFEFLASITQSATAGNVAYLSPAMFQPIAAEDVAEVVADVATGQPLNGMIQIGGPERKGMDVFVKEYLDRIGDERKVVTDVHAKYFGAELNDQTLVPGGNPRLGKIDFETWIKTQHVPA